MKQDHDITQDLIYRSAFLRREAIGMSVSANFRSEQNGVNREIHVFDTDIIKCLCAPWKVGPLAGQGRQGYGQLLPRSPAPSPPTTKNPELEDDWDSISDAEREKKVDIWIAEKRAHSEQVQVYRSREDKQAIKVAEMLTTSCLEGAQEMPLLQLPGHYNETEDVYGRVKEDAGDKNNREAMKFEKDYFLRGRLASLFSIEREMLAQQGAGNEVASDTENVRQQIVREVAERWVDAGQTGTASVRKEFLNYCKLTHDKGHPLSVADTEKVKKAIDENVTLASRQKEAFLEALRVCDPKGRSNLGSIAHDILTRFWSRRLSLVKSTDRLSNHGPDVEALTHLSLINGALVGSGLRVILNTGDRRLVEAAYGNLVGIDREIHEVLREKQQAGTHVTKIETLYDDLKDFLNLDDEDDAASEPNLDSQTIFFSMNYVRHLWAYAGEALFDPASESVPDQKSDSPNTAMRGFFDGLLAKTTARRDLSTSALERIIRNRGEQGYIRVDEDLLVEALEEFEELTRKSIERFDIHESENSVLQKKILETIRNTSGSASEYEWVDVIREIDRWHYRIQDKAALPLSKVGADILLIDSQTGVRNPPDLIFDGLIYANQALNLLTHRNLENDQQSFHEVYDKIDLDCGGDDADDRVAAYLKYLILAAAFASGDRWFVAHSHAQRAIAIKERAAASSSILTIPRPSVSHGASERGGFGVPISGREAYFLAAVCSRILCEGDKNVSDPEELLGKAREALEVDKKVLADVGKPVSDWAPVSLRFANEELALALSRYYLARKTNENEHNNTLCDLEATFVFDAYKRLLKACLPNAADMGPGHVTPRFLTDVRDITRNAIAVNFLQVAIIAVYRHYNCNQETSFSVDRQILEWSVTQTYMNFLNSNGTFETLLIKFYRNVGLLLLKGGDADFLVTRNTIDQLFDKKTDALITSYDDWRYEKLHEFAVKVAIGAYSFDSYQNSKANQ